MDTRTGLIHETLPGETMEQMAVRVGARPDDMVPIASQPAPTCKKCNGTGSVKAGMFSKRWKPCRCTY